MTDDLTWHDAIQQTGLPVSFEDARKGWPVALCCWHVAMLQRVTKPERLALHWALAGAVNSGTMSSVRKPLLMEFSGMRRDIHGNVHGKEAPVPEMRYVQEAFVTAADVVKWLQSKGEVPSVFVTQWHDATTIKTPWMLLIEERNQSMGFSWEPRHAQVIQAEEARRMAEPGARAVRKSMATEMSVGGKSISPQNLFGAMRKHLQKPPK
jgi:hypothetical protein